MNSNAVVWVYTLTNICTYGKRICDFLCVNMNNLPLPFTLHRFRDYDGLLVQCSPSTGGASL